MANSSFTVDGIASGGSGTVTNIATTAPIAGGPITTTGTISLNNSSVTPGTYDNATITVDSYGLVQSASSGSLGTIGASASINDSSGSVVVYKDFNITSYVFQGTTGYWRVNFTVAFANAFYLCSGNCGNVSAGNAVVVQQPLIAAPTTLAVIFATGTSAGTAGTSDHISLIYEGQ